MFAHRFLSLAVLLAISPLALAQNGPMPADNGITVLPRGPLHEAFAQPAQRNAQATPLIPKRPPEPIPEEPPEQKPQAENVQWIPGYWAWDNERNDFLWVSGVWRVPPPGHNWVPGYWTQAAAGWQWVPGYWGIPNQQAPQFLPAPPGSLDEGPSAPAPNDTSIYVPGSWIYGNAGYAWRPGFWSTAYSNWVWNTGYYTWTPAGYVYVNGFWDYTLAQRGLAFAPVAFNQPLWTTASWVYRPNFVIGVNGLLGSLFVRPGAYSYFYGSYYSPLYATAGYVPWYSYGRRFGDPLFTYYRWTNRTNPNWWTSMQTTFVARQNGARVPPVVTPLHQFRAEEMRLHTPSASQLAHDRSAAEQLRALSASRSTLESAPPPRRSFYRAPAEGAIGFEGSVRRLPPPPTVRSGHPPKDQKK